MLHFTFSKDGEMIKEVVMTRLWMASTEYFSLSSNCVKIVSPNVLTILGSRDKGKSCFRMMHSTRSSDLCTNLNGKYITHQSAANLNYAHLSSYIF